LLFSDKIVVRGKQTLQSDFEYSFPLETFDPTPDKLHFRSQIFTWATWMTLIGFVGCSILVNGLHMSFGTAPPGMVGCVGIAGFLLMVATYRKVEYFRFKNTGGIVILDIARAGKETALLEPFVEALKKQIRATRGLA